MPYIVEVDQSGKIEQSGPTVLAFSDGISHAILVPSEVKTEGFHTLRKRGKSREIALLLLFSACLYLLLKGHLDQLQKVIIDEEYTGQEDNIKSFLLEYAKRRGQFWEPERVDFARVGKGSPADKKARAVREGKDKGYREIALEELLELVE